MVVSGVGNREVAGSVGVSIGKMIMDEAGWVSKWKV